MTCIFCVLDRKVVAENEHAIAFLDSFPVSPGHSLVVPRRHVPTIMDLGTEEYQACFLLVRQIQERLQVELKPDGFNVGVNCGEVAGQTVLHAHIHVIPRFKGDTAHPRGGVRNVIPHKADY